MHGDLCKHLGIDSSTVLESIPKCLHRSPHGDLCKHLGIDSSTDLDDRYSNLFLNAYIDRHVHAKYLTMI